MSRTMSGIPTSGGGGDVFLAGNPNTFTGTNTFNTNRPTSDLTSTPADEDFITKQDGESLFTNNTGDVTLDGGTEASPQWYEASYLKRNYPQPTGLKLAITLYS